MSRRGILDAIAGLILALARPHPVRVAIDGVDAAGKTTFADELAECILSTGRPIIRASIDGFHHPRSVRYGRGPDSPEGYYLDSFNYEALVTQLLTPLGPGGSRLYRRAIFDFRSDTAVESVSETAPENAVLVFDGVFLLRPELRAFWDFSIFVRATFETTLARAQQRDLALFGTAQAVEQRYLRRYIPAQRRYLEQCRPEELACVVLENDHPERPTYRRNS